MLLFVCLVNICNRLVIGETWTRVPFGGSAGPIGGVIRGVIGGVIRDNNDFLKKLKSLDDQLCAIEATAETMAGDLKASNRVGVYCKGWCVGGYGDGRVEV